MTSIPSVNDPWVARLLADPILVRASHIELARLVPYLEERKLAPGETLYHAGDAAQAMYLLLSGDISLVTPEGHAQAAPDGRVGEEAAGEFGTHLTDATSEHGASLLLLPREPLLTLLLPQQKLRAGLAQSF